MKTLNRLLTAVLLLLSATIAAAQQKKSAAAVLEFVSTDLARNEMINLTNRFRTALSQTQAFDLIERAAMQEILKEQDFTMSDQCNAAECAVQIGRLLGAELMVAGDVGRVGKLYTIDIRLIDVTTGRILQAIQRDQEGDIEEVLDVMGEIAYDVAVKQKSAVGVKMPDQGRISSVLGIPSNVIRSILVPGWGGYYVDQDKMRAAFTTASAVGLVVYGLYWKSESNRRYDKYRSETIQANLSSLHKKANRANHRYWIATRAAAVIWISDIVYVAVKGARNRQAQTAYSRDKGLNLNLSEGHVCVRYEVSF